MGWLLGLRHYARGCDAIMTGGLEDGGRLSYIEH